MQKKVSKKEWVDMFREVGVTDADMMKWHRLFENRHPEAHGDFLGWLGISSDEVQQIRENSR